MQKGRSVNERLKEPRYALRGFPSKIKKNSTIRDACKPISTNTKILGKVKYLLIPRYLPHTCFRRIVLQQCPTNFSIRIGNILTRTLIWHITRNACYFQFRLVLCFHSYLHSLNIFKVKTLKLVEKKLKTVLSGHHKVVQSSVDATLLPACFHGVVQPWMPHSDAA